MAAAAGQRPPAVIDGSAGAPMSDTTKEAEGGMAHTTVSSGSIIPVIAILFALAYGACILLTIGLVTYNSRVTNAAVLDMAENWFDAIGNAAGNHLNQLHELLVNDVRLAAEQTNLASPPDLVGHEQLQFLLTMLMIHPQLSSVYIGYGDGGFFQAYAFPPERGEQARAIEAPEGTRFATRLIFRGDDGKGVEVWRYLAADQTLIGSRVDGGGVFDPRERPWFRAAGSTGQPIEIGPYRFSSTREVGVTAAMRLPSANMAVFAIDLPLTNLGRYLSEQATPLKGFLGIVDMRGQLIARSAPRDGAAQPGAPGPDNGIVDIRKQSDPVSRLLTSQLARTGASRRSREVVELDGVTYVSGLFDLGKIASTQQMLAIVAPIDAFTVAADTARRHSLIGAAILLIALVPIVGMAARAIARPLTLLAQQSDEIARLCFDGATTTVSRIHEVRRLEQAIATMRSALRALGLFVPLQLTRQLIRPGTEPRVGGERRTVAVMFTDIAGFTDLAEVMDPDALADKLGAYFAQMSFAVLSNHGTIDKFIGDAIMAFWNAPTLDGDHVRNACLAALALRDVSRGMNGAWLAAGEAPLPTRIGLHLGDAIVGNFGSQQRLNYTAVGATVNLAARLEGLNSRFGTDILVSKAIADAAGPDFLFRPIGVVRPKGISAPVEIFELLAHRHGGSDREEFVDDGFVEAWCAAMTNFRNGAFDLASDRFLALLAVRPADAAAAHYARLARSHANDPPADDWDAIDVFSTK